MNYLVKHPRYGSGRVQRIYGHRIDIDFEGRTVAMVFPGAFSTGLTTDDPQLQQLVREASECIAVQQHDDNTPTEAKTDVLRIIGNFRFDFISARVKSLDFSSNEELFELIGYMAKPGILQGIWAEIPESAMTVFRQYFPDETIMPITAGTTAAGQANKFGVQCRINFRSVDNCPPILQPVLAQGLGRMIVNRLNRTLFALQLVKFFGFHFGNEVQPVDNIRQIAADYGYLDEFNKGYDR